MKWRLAAVIILLLCGSYAGYSYFWFCHGKLEGVAPVLRNGVHPRIYLDGDRISLLREASKGSHSNIWIGVKAEVDRKIAFVPPAELKGDFRPIGDLIAQASLCYLISGEDKYLELARRHIKWIVGQRHWGNDSDIEAAHLLYGLAVGYDWLYGALDKEEIAAIRKKLVLQGERMRRSGGKNYPYLNNHRVVIVCSLGVAALVLYPDVPQAEEWLLYANSQMKKTMSRYGQDGYSSEGINYWNYSVENMLKYFTASDELLGTEFLKSPWLRNAALCPLYFSLPRSAWSRDNLFINPADSARFSWHHMYSVLYKLASLNGRGDVQWLADELFGSGLARESTSWFAMLWYDPALKARIPEDTPTTAFFTDWDIAVMRSSWSSNATICSFICSPSGGHQLDNTTIKVCPDSGHSQPDANSFMIFGDGEWLAADTGSTTIKRAADHNTVLFNGFGEEGEGERWFKQMMFRKGHRARFLHKESTALYDYVVGDASSVYRKEAGVTGFLRHFLYIKPGTVMVADELSAQKESEFSWLLHSPGEITRVDSNRCVVSNGGAFLQVLVLEPAGVKISIESKKVDADYPKYDWTRLNLLRLTGAGPSVKTSFLVVMHVGDPARSLLNVRRAMAGGQDEIEITAGTVTNRVHLSGFGKKREMAGIVSSVE